MTVVRVPPCAPRSFLLQASSLSLRLSSRVRPPAVRRVPKDTWSPGSLPAKLSAELTPAKSRAKQIFPWGIKRSHEYWHRLPRGRGWGGHRELNAHFNWDFFSFAPFALLRFHPFAPTFPNNVQDLAPQRDCQGFYHRTGRWRRGGERATARDPRTLPGSGSPTASPKPVPVQLPAPTTRWQRGVVLECKTTRFHTHSIHYVRQQTSIEHLLHAALDSPPGQGAAEVKTNDGARGGRRWRSFPVPDVSACWVGVPRGPGARDAGRRPARAFTFWGAPQGQRTNTQISGAECSRQRKAKT